MARGLSGFFESAAASFDASVLWRGSDGGDDDLGIKLISAAFAAFAAHCALSWVQSYRKRSSLARMAALKRAERDALVDEWLNAHPTKKGDEEILKLTAGEISDAIKEGDLDAAEAVRACCSRAAMAARQLSCVAEVLFFEAYEEAQQLDAKLEKLRSSRSKRSKSELADLMSMPLLGVPVSIKDQVNVKGCDSTCGSAARVFKPSTEDSYLVSSLREAGAIVVVRGSTPQCLMIPESVNNIWGRSKNPHNPKRTPGGSSGGEGALVASNSIPLAIGTDIGGSIRIPAHYCGVAGFKPTPQRVTKHGLSAPRPRCEDGQNAIRGVAGPLGRCVEDLATVMRCWWGDDNAGMRGVDPFAPKQGFCNDSVDIASLRVGVFYDDGWFEAAPSCVRAVKEAEEALRDAGCEVVPFTFFDEMRERDGGMFTADYVKAYYGALSSDGNLKSFMSGLEGEALIKEYSQIKFLANVPRFVRPLLSAILRLVGQHRPALINSIAYGKTTYEFWQQVILIKRFKAAITGAMRDAGIDALLCPGHGLPAIPHGAANALTPSCSYTFLFNLIDFPAGSVPVTKVREGECEYASRCSDNWSKAAAKALKGSEGLPINVQIATLPYEDELCLSVMTALESSLNQNK